MKRIEEKRVKPTTPSQVTDAFIEDEEQKRKWKKEKQKVTESRSPTQLPWTIQSPHTMHRGHTVSLFVLPTQPTWRILLLCLEFVLPSRP